MSATILISTGARLHFGFFAHAGTQPMPIDAINYGGIGVMIDSPGFVLAASGHEPEPRDPGQRKPGQPVVECGLDEVRCNLKRASRAGESDPFAGPPFAEWPDLASRALKFIAMYRQRCTERYPPAHCDMELWAAIPSHHGLGAGTQLGMAVATALAQLADDDVDRLTLARRVGRGARSALGIHGFDCGGFLVDAGKDREEAISSLETRVDVPAGWRFLLINPPGAATGLSGTAESAALSRLPATSAAMTQWLRQRVTQEMLPALTSGDCDRFGEALFEFGQTVGEYFRPIQGGTYATVLSSELVDWIRRQGFRGVAQTSWGPTLAVCCIDQQSAELVREKLQSEPDWQQCRTRITRPLNTGAKVQQISSSETG
jgi:beta-ribofuranosylaminobenzene 5'-phosphate synthase